MNENVRLCFLIADGEHARLVRPNADNVLDTAMSFDSASAHLASHDLGSDRPGRTFESATTGRHGVAPKHDLHELAKVKFAQFVATQLDQAVVEDAFDRLVLVAPAHTLNAIAHALGARATAKVVGKLAKDLVKVPNHALSSHLREWVAEPHRAT